MQQKATNNIWKKPPITKPKPINERNMVDAHLSLFPTLTTLPTRVATHQSELTLRQRQEPILKLS
jgi:hypothetical protein